MSLSAALAQAVRPAVPAAVLKQCREHDRAVVENILYVALEVLPRLSVDLATCECSGGKYVISVPTCGQTRVSMRALRQLVSYSPSRIEDIGIEAAVLEEKGVLRIIITICDENTRASFAEFDVMRISKRSRLA